MSLLIFGRRPATLITPFVLFTAFILLLLVSLSLPIIRPLYLFEIAANLDQDVPRTSIATSVRFGLWGYCLGAYKFQRTSTVFEPYNVCSKATVGFTVDPTVQSLLGIDQSVTDVILKALTVFLIVHPVACGLTFLTIFPSLLRVVKNTTPQFVQISTLIISIFPAVLTTVVLVIDIVLVIIAKQRVREVTKGELDVHWGNAVWMIAVAVALLWAGVIGLSAVACGCCGCGWREQYEKKRRSRLQAQMEKAQIGGSPTESA